MDSMSHQLRNTHANNNLGNVVTHPNTVLKPTSKTHLGVGNPNVTTLVCCSLHITQHHSRWTAQQQHRLPLKLQLALILSLALLEPHGLEQQQGAHEGQKLTLEGVALRADRLVPVGDTQWV
jgi:hypothetical protein